MSSILKKNTWFHGTSSEPFKTWTFPPPPKPGETILFPLSSVYLTSNIEFAKKAGSNIAQAKLKNSLKILDLVNDKKNAEKIRLVLNKRDMYAVSETTKQNIWHKGRKNGDCTLFQYNSAEIEKIILERAANLHAVNIGILSPTQAVTAVHHNLARAHIENICTAAKSLGFNGIYMFERDAHSVEGSVLAQPVLAIFAPGVISDPEW